MGYWAGDRFIFPSRTVKSYTWKLCPYSTQYDDQYPTGLTDLSGNAVVGAVPGNSTGRTHASENDDLTPTGGDPDHPTTDGGMNYKNTAGSPGWACLDNQCPYFITNGTRYFEY